MVEEEIPREHEIPREKEKDVSDKDMFSGEE